ncbi:MAG: PQQ-binding-like beta-propeller repeat protein [Planctomycetales bacterium]|nr:PQQ-binding-like beta-propeller repeat protein [Planctomycetales bacterium]NIP69210.1 PQQ-binding-like beta-propeller repeat protein [Planctomycetales bacterium]
MSLCLPSPYGFRCCRVAWLLACLGFCLASGPARGDSWPSWRGPTRNGISQEANPPLAWSRTKNVRWRLPLPGPAGATPVVWDDRIFLTSVGQDREELLLLSVHKDGKLLWTRRVGGGNEDVRGDEGNFASPSPVTDGQHVWTFMANGLLACYDFAGQEIWKKDLQRDYGEFDIQFGLSSTPVLDGDRLYLQIIHGPWSKAPHKGLVVALDKRTGREVWKQDRVTDAVDECKHSYASPTLYEDPQDRFLITHGADYVIAHDLDTGKEIWRCGGLHPAGGYNSTLRFVASPAAVPGLIVAPTAKGGKVVGIRPGGKGNITGSPDYIAWIFPRHTPDVPSPLIHDGLVYLCRENGNLLVLEAETGQKVYEERTTRDRHRASPVYAAGRIYLTARNGMVTVVRAGRDFEVLARNELGESVTASPVFADGRLYLRSFDALYAFGNE